MVPAGTFPRAQTRHHLRITAPPRPAPELTPCVPAGDISTAHKPAQLSNHVPAETHPRKRRMRPHGGHFRAHKPGTTSGSRPRRDPLRKRRMRPRRDISRARPRHHLRITAPPRPTPEATHATLGPTSTTTRPRLCHRRGSGSGQRSGRPSNAPGGATGSHRSARGGHYFDGPVAGCIDCL